MALVREISPAVYRVELETIEYATLRQHGSRNELCITDALADCLEFALASFKGDILQEDKEVSEVKSVVPDMVGFTLCWDSSGPYATFNGHDRKFVASVMSMSLREALTVVLYKKIQKGDNNELEV